MSNISGVHKFIKLKNLANFLFKCLFCKKSIKSPYSFVCIYLFDSMSRIGDLIKKLISIQSTTCNIENYDIAFKTRFLVATIVNLDVVNCHNATNEKIKKKNNKSKQSFTLQSKIPL